MDVARVLDTNVVLYLLRGDLMQPLEPADYYVSVITEMELLSFPGLDRAGEAAMEEFLGAVTVVDLTLEIRRAAIALRRRHPLKLPDMRLLRRRLRSCRRHCSRTTRHCSGLREYLPSP